MSPRNTQITDQLTDTCPTRELLERIGSKWSIQIIGELTAGTRRFTELERAIDGISRRMLARTLRGLERDGLLIRTVYATVPVTVEYTLAPLAAGLVEPLTALVDWARTHRTDVLSARHAYDTAHDNTGQGDC
ncbi:winged helix-turn-helix transcriptional regulator [Nocardia blacklockiae]|uniref:winged helix-turn-helix transcriptional regulator n=1 Tax=Nocardia blacklockiae TaxID=480036 RepID=UPI0018944E18|nr:helix-turn-helix domain-containing protein [Nocardia blacklockiae]MBF6171016.1 helix-turn-helix transcriptional regulator [Nocardia blacklockiae]